MRKEATQQWRKPPQERKKPSGKEERGALKWWGVYWGVLTSVYWAHGGRRWYTGMGTMAVATSGHKEAHPSSSSSGCLGSDAAALKLRPSCPNHQLCAEDEEEDEDVHTNDDRTWQVVPINILTQF